MTATPRNPLEDPPKVTTLVILGSLYFGLCMGIGALLQLTWADTTGMWTVRIVLIACLLAVAIIVGRLVRRHRRLTKSSQPASEKLAGWLEAEQAKENLRPSFSEPEAPESPSPPASEPKEPDPPASP